MGIFELFKKLVKGKESEEIVIKKLAFSEIEDWIENKTKENQIKENKLVLEIQEKIKINNKELKEKINTLLEFNVDSKKEKDHVKNIVIDSRKKYIELVEELMKKLEELEETKLEEIIKKTNKIFLNFNKSSFKNYERATILIGKEMANIKESLKVFSKSLLQIYRENKNTIDFFKDVEGIKENFKKIKEIDNSLIKIKEKIIFLEEKIKIKKSGFERLKEKLEETKKSKAYSEFLESQKELEKLNLDIKEKILELRQLFDFKALANFFHIFPEQMEIVKNHKEDFYNHFLKDNGKAILDLLNKSKLDNNKVQEKINKINLKLEEIKRNKKEIKKDLVQEIDSEIKDILLELEDFKIEKVKEEKRQEKLKNNHEELIELLKKDFVKFGVEVD